MKLTTSIVKQFENEQKESGTKTALSNVLWVLASGLLKDLGYTKVSTK